MEDPFFIWCDMKEVFTIGDVAALCSVSPRTAGKWFDSGRLRGYRLPGSQKRRIPREYLKKFLKEHGFPVGDLDAAEENPPVADEWYRWSDLPKDIQNILHPEMEDASAAGPPLVCLCDPDNVDKVLPSPVEESLGRAYHRRVNLNGILDGRTAIVWFNVVGIML